MLLSRKDITDYENDGAIILRGVFDDWISELSSGADYNTRNPSYRAIVHNMGEGTGDFFEDFCNWKSIPEFRNFVNNSELGRMSSELMNSKNVQFFHDHYLHKYPGSSVATPWHQDMPYYFVDGSQNVSFWIPLESREKEFSLKCALGSHKLNKYIRPTSWSTDESYYEDSSSFMDLPEMNDGDYKIKQWHIEPGDAVAFNYRLIHSANANTLSTETKTLSMRLIGDDAVYKQRPGKTSPNYDNINQKSGERLREDWFPIIYST